MSMTNAFDLLVGFESDDLNQIVASQPLKPATFSEKKTPPPSQTVKDAKNDNARGGGRGGGRGSGGGHSRGGYNRDSSNSGNTFSNNNGYSDRLKIAEEGEKGKTLEWRNYGSMAGGGFRAFRHGSDYIGDYAAEGERVKRQYERRSGTGRGNEIKRDGAGKGNWGTTNDAIAPATEEPINENENVDEAEKQVADEVTGDSNKDTPGFESEEKPEAKEMTLYEYEKVLEEKRKALLALKAEERKVVVDKEFEKMQLLSNKKNDEEIFAKLGSDKDKRKEAAEKEEKAKKQSVNISEFLKPAERSGGAGGRRGGRGGRGGPREGFTGRLNTVAPAPSITDIRHFPSLCAK